MTHIVLASTAPELEARIAEVIGGVVPPVRLDRLPDHGEALLNVPSGPGLPEMLIMDGTAEPEAAIALAGRITEIHPSISIVLIAAQEADIVLAAVRAGIRDVVDPGDAELGPVLHRALDGVRRRQPAVEVGRPTQRGVSGRVISVVSPKGGVGKTTVSTNIAVGLAEYAPEATVLVDLDVQFGDVASGLDLDPEYFLADAVSAQALRDPMVLKTFLTRHSSGLHVICAPELPAEADTITGDDVGRLLDTLAAEFRYVIVDTAPGLGEHSLAALDRTTDLVLLTNMEVPGVRGLRKELDVLAELGLLPQSRQVVVNFTDKRGLLNLADIEAVLATKVDLHLPRSKAATAAVNEGVPLLTGHRRDALTKAIRTLVRRLRDAGPVPDSKPIDFLPLTPAPSEPDATGATPAKAQPTDRKAVRPRHAASRWRGRMVA